MIRKYCVIFRNPKHLIINKYPIKVPKTYTNKSFEAIYLLYYTKYRKQTKCTKTKGRILLKKTRITIYKVSQNQREILSVFITFTIKTFIIRGTSHAVNAIQRSLTPVQE